MEPGLIITSLAAELRELKCQTVRGGAGITDYAAAIDKAEASVADARPRSRAGYI
jgi:hypothetical protein